MTDPDIIWAMTRLGDVFTPRGPIGTRELLAGRYDLLLKLIQDITSPAQHALLYGDRGVGKSSIARVLALVVEEPRDPNGRRSVFISCDSNDTYGSIWRKVFQEILIRQRQLGLDTYFNQSIVGRWDPDEPIEAPNDVRLLLTGLPNPMTIVIDEYDRIELGGATSRLMTDTIKLFSDSNTPVTIVLVGVGQSIERLVSAHESISRNIDYAFVEPMQPHELAQIIQKGYEKVGMTFEPGLDMKMAQLSQGYPHYTHLLGLWSGIRAAERNSQEVTGDDLSNALPASVENAAGGIRVEYDKATDSNQPNNLFKEVLLSCALAEKDVRGRFSLKNLQTPLQRILGDRKINRYSYQRHLSLFCGEEHGNVLVKTGRAKTYRWHFSNPQLIPFVRLQGIHQGLVNDW